MNEVYLLTGGNMGNREQTLLQARKAIEKNCGNIIHISSLYETEPWGISNQAFFLNQALHIRTALPAHELLACLLRIEAALGRKRDQKYGPRIIDIDILLFNDAIIDSENLKVPHPYLHQRRFALQCLADIAGEKIHPVYHKCINELLAACADPLKATKFKPA